MKSVAEPLKRHAASIGRISEQVSFNYSVRMYFYCFYLRLMDRLALRSSFVSRKFRVTKIERQAAHLACSWEPLGS